ncbi:MAG TPA: pyridine nucleotide-disulfide oxidoreductase [Prolixibacteraceae bacterium]|nr:pyridine nucleotide-disulfide oxidoreductase [Prolixibacteraceae bacterium]
MKKFTFLIISVIIVASVFAQNNTLLIEAESFANKGGWVTDQQFMDQMGSPFLMAHGMGIPVKNAETEVIFPKKGKYRLFVRTRNWAARWTTKDAPGKFQVLVNGKAVTSVFGTESMDWSWQDGGWIEIGKTKTKVELKDLTGFNGRCDALIFTTDSEFIPPTAVEKLAELRTKLNPETAIIKDAGTFDFVVIGGGMAGTCAAISAARLGLKVALVQDRPVLGGNNSSEVRVHLGGRINLEPYPNLGNLVNEIGPSKEGNARPYENYEDDKKMKAVRAEKNISLFLNHHANKVNMKDGRIESVVAIDTETGEKRSFTAPIFADCTGDGTIGVLAGAKYLTGRESAEEFGEKTAPDAADNLTMGSSVQWFAEDKTKAVPFPEIQWGLAWDEDKAENLIRGDWNWETGMGIDQVNEFERIRDYGLLVVYSNWSFLKNQSIDKNKFEKRQLKWVAYIAGKRESRRLIGDYILSESDLTEHKVYPDGTASTSWTIDLHYPDPENTKQFPGSEFKSIAKHTPIHPYPIPFRCLYSQNVPNLMMAGRNISVSHVALGTVRVMRTTGMMGEVIGMAALVCKQNSCDPRKIYSTHFEELKKLMQAGTGNPALPKIQNYNEGSTLGPKKVGDSN